MADEVKRRDAYIGEKKNQLRNGFGVYEYENKFFKYEGEWKDGQKHGHGKLSMADGSYYEGEFKNGEIDGHGYKYFCRTGNTYSGEFVMGELHGQGVMNYKDTSTYEGDWHRNLRQGYGVYRCQDNSIYQGYLHKNMRHGQGTQIYTNGDRYNGEWVKDKRQGHGELRTRDGTVYSGQWYNDLFNGEGRMSHSSGMVYTGLWINGVPAQLATKLSFEVDGAVELVQGAPFRLEVKTLDVEGNIVKDAGREIQVSAGFKYMTPSTDDAPAAHDVTSGLFDVIEDVEERPLPTPFGYSVLPYPLTDQFPYEENDEALLGLGSRTNTAMSEMTATEDPVTAKEAKRAKEEEGKEVDTAEVGESTTEATTDEGQTVNDQQDTQRDEVVTVAATLPPPVSSRRCEVGSVVFDNLVLSAPPPMYRPFMEETEKKTSKSRLSKRSDEDAGSRPATRSKTASNLGDERFARGGEYVVVAQDVTTPPFMGRRLEPAFILVKITVPKKAKVKKHKDKGPKWDTNRHITSSMARSYTDMAGEEEYNLILNNA